ncbi:MAG: peptidylprolyl isomerase [Acidimicrobiales bacterium]
MRSKPFALVSIVVAIAAVASSCGVSRDADVAATTTAAPTTVTTDTPPSTDAPTGPYTAPDYAGIQTAAILDFADGTSTEIDVAEVADVVDQLADNPEAVDLLFAQGLPPTFDLDILSSIIQIRILDKGIAEENATVPADAIDTELATLYVQIDGIISANEDPEADRATIEAGVSEYLEVVAEQRVKQVTYTSVFEQSGESVVPCTRHILLESESEADDAVQRLADGEDFAELAIELSTGPSGPDGGDLGCSDPNGFVPEFRDAVLDASEGEVIGPVQTDFGWHVIVVYGSDTVPADPSLAQQLAFESYSDLQSSTEILVDPGIGQWDDVATRVTP